MKTIMLNLLLSTSFIACNNTVESTPFVDIIEPVKQIPIEFLIDAMIYVESKGDSAAIGDGGRAVGVLQIWPIMVRDVNRILGKYHIDFRYNYNDRYSPEKSVEMFYIWKSYYHPYSSYEVIARCWNGGTNGHRRSSTRNYWYKVNNRMEELIWAE
jgi:hypothetical protein